MAITNGREQEARSPQRGDRGSCAGVGSTQPQPYSLGASDAEMARLDAQADSIAAATAVLLRSAGIAPGMRVLDLGTGLGHVAFQLTGLVGPAGSVLGIDQAEPMLTAAEQRRLAAGIENLHFAQADVRTFRDQQPFDTIVGRLILFHLPDAFTTAALSVATG